MKRITSLMFAIACVLPLQLGAAEGFSPLVDLTQKQYVSLDSATLAEFHRLESLASSQAWSTLDREAERLGKKLAKRGHRTTGTYGLIAVYRAISAARMGDDALAK